MELGQQKRHRSWPAVKYGTGPVKRIQHLASNKGWNLASKRYRTWPATKNGTWPVIKDGIWLAKDTEPRQQ
jgi:hypothetical protein